MVQIKDFEFSIVQQGNAVPEHEDISCDDTLNARTLYAEIIEDSNFQLRIVCGPRMQFGSYQALLVEVSVDGQAVNGKCFPRHIFEPHQSRTLTISGPQRAVHRKTLVQNFRFTESETRVLQESETLDEAREEFKAQGTIKIDVSRAYGSFTNNSIDVAERAEIRYPKAVVKEKGSTTCVAYVDQEKIGDFETFDMNLAEAPLATVIYKYRTEEVLRDLQIKKSLESNTNAGQTIISLDNEDDELEIEIEQLDE